MKSNRDFVKVTSLDRRLYATGPALLREFVQSAGDILFNCGIIDDIWNTLFERQRRARNINALVVYLRRLRFDEAVYIGIFAWLLRERAREIYIRNI